jgi:LPXTG-motif cell wall-anchored protein
MKDETKHYTFDIDATLFGDSSYPASELVKIGLDKDGKEITDTIELPGNKNPIGALQGAKFKLYVANSDSTTKIKNEQGTEINASVYNNGIYDDDTEFVSDANGRITAVDADVAGIRGLDAGTYYLVETDAPDGYIKAQNGVKIVIDATIEDETHKTYYDKVTGTEYNAQNQEGTLTEVTWTVPELKSYSVTINGVETAHYTMTNEEKPNKGDGNDVMNPAIGEDGLIGATGAGSGAANGKIQNTQGVELPSTGGIGTTLFYTIGAILIIGAGIVLITRRRMSVQ